MKSKTILISIPLLVIFFSNNQIVFAQNDCTDDTGAPILCPPSDDTNTEPSAPVTPTYRFQANDENYLDPTNWNTNGRIPGPGETALVDGKIAVIDPRDPAPIPLGNLLLRNGAHFIARDGVMTANVVDACNTNTTLELYNFDLKANTVFYGGFGVKLNPSFLEAERIMVCDPETISTFGLGGTQSTDHSWRGPGHYAHMESGSIDLDGELDLFLAYGVYPEPGQTFEIISNTGDTPINGTFANATEGAIIDGFCDIQFRITYQGGDGNDVVLTAEERTEPDPKCDDNFDTPSSDHNVILDNGTTDLLPDRPIEVDNILLHNGTELNLQNADLTANTLDANASIVNLYNSHLKVNIFIADGEGQSGTTFNPSFLEANRIVIINSDMPVRFGLGGSEPAAENQLGEGYYARIQGNTVQLDGSLEVFFKYNFAPQAGQQFEVVTVNHKNGLNGEFDNAPEGTIVGGYCDIALRISYGGGDSNDVVLKTEKKPNPDPNWMCETETTAENIVAFLPPENDRKSITSNNRMLFIAGSVGLSLLALPFLLRKKR